ncbi:MAG: macro domain-containing protein [Anaerolineales bacterium]|nr:macro domain-containing protein [Anaerolineales bacterium]
MNIKLILIDPKPALCTAWRTHFNGLPNVEVIAGYFEELPEFDCMVSAANSFGLMDGGVDLAIIRFFGYALQDNVQKRILYEYLGEQPVGTSMIVETGNATHPYIAHTPTMRVPMEIIHTDNVYKAMWAMLLAVRNHNLINERKILTIACPGLGTATGRVPYPEAARQMAVAYRYYLSPPQRIDWRVAEGRQTDVRFGGDMGFHIPPETEF